MAVANALIQFGDRKDEMALGDAVALKLQEYCRTYPCKIDFLPMSSRYGGGFRKWVEQGDIRAFRKANSNGGAMRAAPIGWLYSSMGETLKVAQIATERTHDSREAIESAQMVAVAVFLARRTKEKDIIRRYAEQVYAGRVRCQKAYCGNQRHIKNRRGDERHG